MLLGLLDVDAQLQSSIDQKLEREIESRRAQRRKRQLDAKLGDLSLLVARRSARGRPITYRTCGRARIESS